MVIRKNMQVTVIVRCAQQYEHPRVERMEVRLNVFEAVRRTQKW